MKLVYIFLVVVAVNLCGEVNSQPNYTSIQSLQIGDIVPDIDGMKMYNYSSTTANLYSFKNKLLIIDFWDTHCLACIEAFPKLERLCKEFKGNVSVLLVTYQDKKTVSDFLSKREKIMGRKFPLHTVIEDKKLNKLFPHKFQPHVIWVNQSGKVKYITQGFEVTDQSVGTFLEEKPLTLTEKTDFLASHDWQKPLYVNGNGGAGEEFLYHSLLTRRIDGLRSIRFMSSDGTTAFIKTMNIDIVHLFQIAYDDYQNNLVGMLGIPSNRTILKVKDSSKYVGILNGVENFSSEYCYELIMPRTDISKLKARMRDDLKAYFGNIEAHLEKRMMICLVLSASDTSKITSNAFTKNQQNRVDQFEIDLNNFPFKQTVMQLTYQYLNSSPYPLIDETGIRGNVTLKVSCDLKNWESLANELKKYSIDLKLQEREVNVLVINDEKDKSQ